MKTKKYRGLILVLTLTALTVLLSGCAGVNRFFGKSSDKISVIETDEGLRFLEDGQDVLFYQRKAKSIKEGYSRADYVHPLYSLDGGVLTEDFPADHLHHRGVFWAWHQVWIGDKRIGDGWVIKDITWEVADCKVERTDKESAALRARVFWKSPLWTDRDGRQKPFVEQNTVITVHRVEADIRKIDFEICLLALEKDVRIGGAEGSKEYSGFSIRLKLPDEIKFSFANGEFEPTRTPIDKGAWINMTGSFVESENAAGTAILCHESTPGFPQKWILRRKASMQNAVFPGRDSIVVPTEKPLVLRYRLLVHKGQLNAEDIEKQLRLYNSKAD
ncbi:MAG: hypothetical protein E4H40_00060 [Candidatus Brocadiia bacterium]|nr:MAG: hypothetical protein E4H40_00060 [Candidatus Brocadiia bacterium]